jgi:hypothetical protein
VFAIAAQNSVLYEDQAIPTTTKPILRKPSG